MPGQLRPVHSLGMIFPRSRLMRPHSALLTYAQALGLLLSSA
jgi:hypothetical protein